MKVTIAFIGWTTFWLSLFWLVGQCGLTFGADPLSASVRITVQRGPAQNIGTGTTIGSNASYSYVLTCCHVFDADPASPGWQVRADHCKVEAFDEGKPTEHRGDLLAYNERSDIAFVRVNAPDLPACEVLPEAVAVTVGAPVVSVGCKFGRKPTLWHHTVIAVDRWLGPPTIDVEPGSVSGRSGGGLFTQSGVLIGVCSATADGKQEALFNSTRNLYGLFRRTSDQRIIGAGIEVGGVKLGTGIDVGTTTPRVGLGANIGPLKADLGVAAEPPAITARKTTLYLFSTKPCPPCNKFDADYQKNASGLRATLDAQYTIERKDLTKDAALAKRLGVSRAPHFITADRSVSIEGYRDATEFLVALKGGSGRYERGSVPLAENPADLGMPSNPRIFEFDPPQPRLVAGIASGLFDPNWLNVDIVVCIPHGSLGGKVASAAEFAKEHGFDRNTLPVGEAEDTIAGLTDGKARPHFVTDIFSPHRFESYIAATRLTKTTPSITAFVKQEATGVRGAIVGLLEKLATSKIGHIELKHAAISVVFERVQPDKYRDALAAVNSAEPPAESPPEPTAPGGTSPLGAAGEPAKKEDDGVDLMQSVYAGIAAMVAKWLKKLRGDK